MRTDGSCLRAARMAPHRVWLITAVGPPPWAMTIDGMDPPLRISCYPARGLQEAIEAKIGQSCNGLCGRQRKVLWIYVFLIIKVAFKNVRLAPSGPSQLRSGTAPETTLSAAATFSR